MRWEALMTGEKLRVLGDEQAALRRIATLAARGAPQDEVFAAAVEEVGRLLSVDLVSMSRYESDGVITFVATWGRRGDFVPVGRRLILGGKNLNTIVFETGRPARLDSFSDASGPVGLAVREWGVRAAVGTPIIVDGRVWGMMAAGSSEEELAADAAARLADFTELLGMAIANAESRAGLVGRTEEQAALRRVATLVAGRAQPEEVFAAVVKEVGHLLPVDFADMGRYEPDSAITFVAAWSGTSDSSPVGSRWSLEGKNLGTIVFRTGRPARIDSYADASGPLGVAGRERGFCSAVGTPIIVEDRLWGVVIAGSTVDQPLPADTEARLADFTELLATAIANAESRAGLARLAEEQAALRRVATLVARGVPPHELFAAVTEEVGRLLVVEYAEMGRYQPDGTFVVLGTWGRAGRHLPVGSRWRVGGKNLVTIVFETGRSARIDSYADAFGSLGVAGREQGLRSAAGTPIIVEHHVWGVIVVGLTLKHALPADTEARLANFTELLATAIANAESRAGLAQLADQQAALRRVATLVARGTPEQELFETAVEEVGRLLPVEIADMARYEPDGTLLVLASWGRITDPFPVGSRRSLGGKNLGTIVFQTGRSARIDDYRDASGPVGVGAREAGYRSAVGTPILVEGRLWGLMIAGSTLEDPLPADIEARLADFTELLATAIANAESRAALAASRARIAVAADETRRRIERDLHDRAQQRLVSLGLELRAAEAAVPAELDELKRALSQIAHGLASVFDELREISHGIHPAILSESGLGPALRALGRRAPVPVELDLCAELRLPEPVEVAAYYVVSEALTNAAKHAHASVVHVELEVADTTARLAIRDDGTGGADPRHGSGLVGLSDRIAALGGRLQIISPAGQGTTLLIEVPLEGQSTEGPPSRRGDPHLRP
jgi:GAF domain-containing protein